MASILCVDPSFMGRVYRCILEGEGHTIYSYPNAPSVREHLENLEYDLAIVVDSSPEGQLIRDLRKRGDQPIITLGATRPEGSTRNIPGNIRKEDLVDAVAQSLKYGEPL